MAKDRMILDKHTFHTVQKILVNSYLYPISSVTQLQLREFEELNSKLEKEPVGERYEVDRSDVNLIREAIRVVISEMPESDINNVLDTDIEDLEKLYKVLAMNDAIEYKSWWAFKSRAV